MVVKFVAEEHERLSSLMNELLKEIGEVTDKNMKEHTSNKSLDEYVRVMHETFLQVLFNLIKSYLITYYSIIKRMSDDSVSGEDKGEDKGEEKGVGG